MICVCCVSYKLSAISQMQSQESTMEIALQDAHSPIMTATRWGPHSAYFQPTYAPNISGITANSCLRRYWRKIEELCAAPQSTRRAFESNDCCAADMHFRRPGVNGGLEDLYVAESGEGEITVSKSEYLVKAAVLVNTSEGHREVDTVSQITRSPPPSRT